MTETESFVTVFLTIIGLAITLTLPVPINEQYKLIIISTIMLLFIVIILSRYDKKINNFIEEQKRLNEKLKIYEQLVDMKADIKYLQKRH